MKRTKLSDRTLPAYSKAEETVNTLTHAIGGAFGLAALVLCAIRVFTRGDSWDCFAAILYGASLVALYSVSSVYHGLRTGMAKKVMQVIDHCTIYLLISGSYTAVALCGIRKSLPALAWGLFFFEWALTALAVTLTAIDLKKYRTFSMICYIGMGWAVIPFWREAFTCIGKTGFFLLLSGGIAYTIGAVLYGIGSKKKWMHSIFHIFVVIGSILHFLCIYGYAMR